MPEMEPLTRTISELVGECAHVPRAQARTILDKCTGDPAQALQLLDADLDRVAAEQDAFIAQTRMEHRSSIRRLLDQHQTPSCSAPAELEQAQLSHVGEGIPLTPEQIHFFIVNGFLHLEPQPQDAALHASILEQATSLGAKKCGELANNILPAIPRAAELLASPAVDGALTSLLGPGYALHPHRFCHATVHGASSQTWHRDSYWGNWHPRHHTPHWMMALYFPQDTCVQMGPTGIMPGTQYFNNDPNTTKPFGVARFGTLSPQLAKSWETGNMSCVCKAGSIFLIHYDLWHRGDANQSRDLYGTRFMFKFQFMRMSAPPAPYPVTPLPINWQAVKALVPQNNQDHTPKQQQLQGLRQAAANGDGSAIQYLQHLQDQCEPAADLTPLYNYCIDWLRGACLVGGDGGALECFEALTKKAAQGAECEEPMRISAAYSCAATVEASGRRLLAQMLVDQLGREERPQCARVLMYAIQALGPSATEPLLERVDVLEKSPFAVFALGHCLELTVDPCVHEAALSILQGFALRRGNGAMSKAHTPRRQAVAGALGCLKHCDAAHVALQVARTDCDGDVRATAMHSLLRLITQQQVLEETLPELEVVLRRLEGDPDRYVTAYVAEAQHRLLEQSLGLSGTSYPILVRWCSKGNGWNARADVSAPRNNTMDVQSAPPEAQKSKKSKKKRSKPRVQ